MSDPPIPGGTATLTIVRRWTYGGSLAPFEIHLDGHPNGVVANGNFSVIRCRPGTHDLVVAQFGRYSQTVRLTVSPGARAELVCRSRVPFEGLSMGAKALAIPLVVFALLYVAVPAVKRELTPYEGYWGPVFLAAISAVLGIGVIQVALVNLSVRMSQPGQFLELAERKPMVSDEQTRVKWVANVSGAGET